MRPKDKLLAAMARLKEAECETTTSAPAADTLERGADGEARTPAQNASTTISVAVAPAPPSSSPCPPEWYSIGSSDIAALLGIDPHRTSVDVWLRLVHGVQQEDDPAMRAGREAERDILARWARRNGRRVFSTETSRADYDGVPFRFQIDGFADDLLGSHGVEVKCPHWSMRPRELDPARPPLHWWAQAQHQQHGARVFGFIDGVGHVRSELDPWRIEACWGFQDDERREWIVPYDADWCARAWDVACDWWHAYVLTKTPPPLKTPAEMAAVARWVYPRVLRPELAEATAEEAALIHEAIAARDTMDTLKTAYENARDRLRYAIGDRGGIVSPVGYAKFSKSRSLLIERSEADGE